jgi:hypothetical protein
MAQLDPNSKKEESSSSMDNINHPVSPHQDIENSKTPENNKDNNYVKEKLETDKQNKNSKNSVNNSNENTKSTLPVVNLEYKYAPLNLDNTNYISQQNIYNNFNQNNYNLYDYNDQSNYDLYYQSLYQMYPQMSDVCLL